MDNGSFLQYTAKKIFEKEKDNFHDTMVLFPNRRAIRFFMQEIKECAVSNTPFFVPQVYSIDEMISQQLTDITAGDNLELVYILYNVYCKVMSQDGTSQESVTQESFEDFYFWGNIVLNDFDQIDKELVNAGSLFRNLDEYKNLEADPNGYLTAEQIELINRLFNTSLGTDGSVMRKNFVGVWNKMAAIYKEFNAVLDDNHLAYPGKMYREFAARLENKTVSLNCTKIKVVGFSVLNNAEKKIFRLLKENYVTDFYWDYDNYYYDDLSNEAGIFIRENLNLFAQSDDLKQRKQDNIISNNQQINIISSPYETTSLAYISAWLDEIMRIRSQSKESGCELNRIAIILNDESLIPLVIKSLPDKYKDMINITMGYPFNQTWLYGEVVNKLCSLADKNIFDRENVFNAIKEIADSLQETDGNGKLWQKAALKKVCNTFLRFVTAIEKTANCNPSGEIIKNIIKRELSAISIDILSDGVNGIQLMGMLETRTLDFDYILMLSANDDNLPKLSKESSFIPYSFRKAYQMMNADRKAGVFAYYFYRLLHNVKRIDYVYVTLGGENKLKEKSRFIRQLESELGKVKNKENFIVYKNLTAVKTIKPKQREFYFDTDDIKFIDSGKKYLSASSLNNLIHCEQKFYLKNILHLNEEITDEDYMAIAFGNVFHNSINIFYQKIEQNGITEENTDALIKESIEEYFNKEESEREKRICSDEIHVNMIKKYIRDVYNLDLTEGNTYITGEKEFLHDLTVGNHAVHFKSRLDRMDYHKEKDGERILRIVDYKTGAKKTTVLNDIKELFCNPSEDKPRKSGTENIFEILFYCYLVYNNTDVKKIKPELMYLSSLDEKDREIIINEGSVKKVLYYDERINGIFEQELKNLLQSFIAKQQKDKYTAVISENKCRFCEYKLLCQMG